MAAPPSLDNELAASSTAICHIGSTQRQSVMNL